MNRAQKRAQAAEDKRRKRIANQRQFHHYQTNARRWCVGLRAKGRHVGDEFEGEWSFPGHVPAAKREDIATYATHAPMRWRVTARCICRTDDGSQYVAVREAECGQVATPNELHELREELMMGCREEVNARHIWDEVFEMECLG